MLLGGLDQINWRSLRGAYGEATSVADAVRSLVSKDAEVREQARWTLSSTIYHQGDIFDSTAAAVPFLMALFASDETPDREALGELLFAIAESAAQRDTSIRKRWQREFAQGRDFRGVTEVEMVNSEIADTRALRRAMLNNAPQIEATLKNPPPDLMEICAQLQSKFRKLQKR